MAFLEDNLPPHCVFQGVCGSLQPVLLLVLQPLASFRPPTCLPFSSNTYLPTYLQVPQEVTETHAEGGWLVSEQKQTIYLPVNAEGVVDDSQLFRPGGRSVFDEDGEDDDDEEDDEVRGWRGLVCGGRGTSREVNKLQR